MKNNTKRIFIMATFAFLFLSMATSITTILAQQGQENETDVDADKYKGKLSAGEQSSFRFRNRFRFQVKSNASADVDIECDVNNVGDQDFQLELNTSSGQKLTVRIMAENQELDMERGKKVQTRSQNKYQYQQNFMLNISLNETTPLQARMGLRVASENAKWAYLNETSQEWVENPSEYKDGILSTDTEHFSVWTVLTPEDEAINGFPIIYAAMSIGLIGLIIRIKRKIH